MKKLVFAVFCAALAYGNNADASLYVCNIERDFANLQYLVSVDYDKAAVFYAERGVFKALEGKTSVFKTMDGGPLKVIVKKPDPKVNWENSEKCYVSGGSKIEFEIRIGADGDLGSNTYYYPKLIKNPFKNNCKYPVVPAARPNPTVCNVLD